MFLQARIPGIIGGAGPRATAQLYLDILTRCRQAGLDRRPPVLIASLDIDLAMEERLLRDGVGVESYRDPLLAAANALVAAGADFLSLPCNTLHVLLPGLAEALSIAVVSILDAVAREVEALECQRVGLLSTAATARTGLYKEGLRLRGIEVVCLEAGLQDALHEQIQNEVDQRGLNPDNNLGEKIAHAFQSQGVEAIIAGCTELKALMASWTLPVPVIDSLDALGAQVVREMLLHR